MIIANGSIAIKTKTAGGIDAVTGYPVVADDVSWSSAIPCQYSANKHDNLGKVNGEHFTIAQYSVLIEASKFSAEQVRLTDEDGSVVGDFSVISVERLPAVGQVKIMI